MDYRTKISGVIGNGTNFENCPAFILDENDYIIGYRVIYGIYFYTKHNLTYNCTANIINVILTLVLLYTKINIYQVLYLITD